ncbi:hypothetical protein GW12_04540 [Acinetobacter sp. HR7]|nr:hypothetical protein GW12_04540 [Acinetobacter sp. HR7]
MFCLITCLAAAIVVKVVPVYVQTHTQEVPAKDTIFSALQLETKQKSS